MENNHRGNVIAVELDCDGICRVVDVLISHIYLQNDNVNYETIYES